MDPAGDQPASFVAGVDHFNAGRFFEAHEAWEELWLARRKAVEAADPRSPGDPPVADFYRGLIQLAAAYHHACRGTLRGAVRLFDSALRRLACFPPGFHSLDRAAAVSAAARHREQAARGFSPDRSELPKLAFRRV